MNEHLEQLYGMLEAYKRSGNPKPDTIAEMEAIIAEAESLRQQDSRGEAK